VAPIGPTEPSPALGDTLPEGVAGGALPDDAAASSHGGRAPTSPEDLERQIRELEARLDRMMREGRGGGAGGAAPLPAAAPEGASGRQADPGRPGDREIHATDYFTKQWGRAGMRRRAEDVDEFGFDPAYEARYRPLFDFLYRSYFRVDVEGIGHIPDEGRCLIVCNHSGGPIPYDGIMLRAALRHEHPRHRELRWLAEDFVYYLPFAGTMMNRLGAVRACQENAERLLESGKLVAVFPEGVKGIGKLYRDRYKLQRFGRGGFIRLCLRSRTPLVPCAIVGAEETNPLLYRFEHLARVLGIPYLPITPTFPALGPLGLVPAPTKWKMRFGEIVRFDAYGPEAVDDEILVGRLAERVRGAIQGLLDRTLAERRSVWFG
jgi:1-acyl-sn-glycerol-3-phosphate acyltransferase